MPINLEADRLLTKARSTLNYVVGSLAQSQEGLDPKETNGLAGVLTDVLENLEGVHKITNDPLVGVQG